MSDLQLIEATLARAARRRRMANGLRGLSRGLLAGAIVWVVVLGVYKLYPISEELVSYAWQAIVAGGLVGFLAGMIREVTIQETARWVDAKTQLQERVSTALEFAREQKEESWKSLLISDAAQKVQKLNHKELAPFHLSSASRWALLLLILGVGLGFVPEYRSKVFVDQARDKEVIKEAGRELAALTKRSLEARPPTMEKTRQAIEEVAQLGERLENAKIGKSEALKDLASATEKLKDQARDLAKDPAIKNLEKAAKSSSKGGAPSADLQKQIDNLSKQLGDKSGNPDALNQLKQKLEQAKDMASSMPRQDTPEGKAAEEKLKNALADMAKQAKDLGLDLPSLSEAMAALANAEPDQVLRDLQVAEVELEKVEAMAKALEKMQLDAQKLGKDLAEQLKNGQAEAAQATLQKMSDQLKEGSISQEQMQQMMKEVSEALEPAKQYGDVGEKLKQATDNMGKGNKQEAGQQLAEAASELGKMMQELGDAQSLLSTLESLQQASMAIANGQGWGAQKSRGRPGAGQGEGQSRGGVGTWHDEESWAYPEYTEKWDNTGVVRDDMEGKALMDRGDGQLADNLAPTKIKGQITPGGPMPSMTMKGVSIKGQSKVQFEAMQTAAQSEAQSALNQDQVPRAYQNAVKNYFDDLKE